MFFGTLTRQTDCVTLVLQRVGMLGLVEYYVLDVYWDCQVNVVTVKV